MTRGETHQVEFSVTSTVTLSVDGILCFEQHTPLLIGQQRSERVVAMFAGALGDGDSAAQQL